MPRTPANLLLATALLAGGVPGADADPGPAVASPGEPLVEVGEAVRRLLWFDVYRVELYLPAARRDVALVENPGVAKAFRVEVLFDGELPEEIPADWAEHVLPPLGPDDRERLRRAYAGLSRGDELLFSYAPGRGTVMEVDGRQVIETGDHAFMAGLLSLFLGPEAPSPAVRQALLGGGGRTQPADLQAAEEN